MGSQKVPVVSQMSTAGLFTAARTEVVEDDPDTPAPHLVALHQRPTREVFDTAVELLASDDPTARELGVLVLRELGPCDEAGRRPFTSHAVPLLLDRLDREKDPKVLRWVISALGYHGAREALEDVLRFAEHPDWRVRFHVAAALPGLADPRRAESGVVGALRKLCQDEAADTRYYALHALLEELAGVDTERSAESVAVLWDDPDPQIRELARAYHGAGR